ncbi:hypothetical protein [Paenibacillus sp. XY044]|uniref:hypothetical protein n=1 Tax=Paenibacillus sp. XY044 TaxID=2026089 RepID=UPI000B9922F7|nr:hypothetical protein [Paenibacillus sp. XY044]OZB98274.1 hypothetical protein CJP46_03685 [Paenibacillus sp. XY044]
MKNTIKISSILLALSLAVAITACGDKQEPAPSTPDQKDEQNNPSGQPGTAEQVPSVKEGTGTYTGQADPHTVEIVVDGKPTAFQLGEGLDQAVADLQEQDHVQFKYEEKAIEGEDTLKQLVLIEIKKSDSGQEEDQGGKGDTSGKDSSSPNASGGSPSESGDSKSSGSSGSISKRPSEGKLEVTLEGNNEVRPAKLVQADGYSLYIPEQFSFDASKHLLYMNIDHEYSVRIEKLPADFNLDQLELQGKEELKPYGEIKKLGATDLTGPMKDALIFLTAFDSSGTHEYIVKELDGSGFVFHVTQPQREASEGFGPLAFAALNSIENE